MKSLLLILFISILSSTISVSQNSWIEKNSFPDQRSGMASFVINGTAYCGLGYDGYSDSNLYNDFYKYDETQDSWTPINNFPGDGRKYTVAFAIGDYGYVGLGMGYSSEFADFYKYDPQTDHWSAIEEFPGAARSSAIAFVIDGKAYVGTGRGDTNYNDMYAYDGTQNTWSQIANFSFSVHDAVAFSIAGKGYVCSGLDVSINGTSIHSGIDEYDPTTNTWTEKEFSDSKLQNRHYSTAWVHDGKAYICGGNMNAEKVITYDPSTNMIEEYNDFGNGEEEFQNPTSFMLGEVAYVVGGHTWEGTSIFNRYAVYFDNVWAMNYNGTPSALYSSKQSLKVKAFPNPSNAIFTITGVRQGTPYSVFNSAGATIETGTVKQNNNCQVNLTNYPDGLFFFQSSNKIIKLIKR